MSTKLNQLKFGAILSYITMGLGYVVSIVYTPIMLRLLGQSEYGLYVLVASVVAYLGVLNFGFGSAYMRYYSRYKVQSDQEKIASLNGMFLVIFSLLGLIAVLAGVVLALNTESLFNTQLSVIEVEKARILMIILVVNLAISFPNIVFTSHITANERFIFQKLVQLAMTLTSPFVVLPILLMGYGSVGMVIGTTILNLSIEIINVRYCLKRLHMRFSFKDFDFTLMKEMSVFSSFIFVNLLIDQINWNLDKFIIGRYRGTLSVAVYGLAAQINMYYISISTAISTVFIPRVHRIVAQNDHNLEITELFTRIGRVQFILLSLVASGLVFFGRPFFNLWAGSNYDESYFIALLLVIPVTIPLIQNIGIEVQRAKNMHQFRSWVYLFIAIGNLLITIPLVRLYGGVGAALGTAIALIIGNGLIMNWYNHVKVGIDMKYFWKSISTFFPALVVPTSFGIIVSQMYNLYDLNYFLGFGFLYVVLFGISMWFLGLNKDEKDIFIKPFERVLRF